MIHIKHNKKPPLLVCQMNCDKQLHAKLNDYEMTRYLNKLSPVNRYNRKTSKRENQFYL